MKSIIKKTSDDYLGSALQLHRYLVKHHWNGQVLLGPDPIGKIHWRITRFVRSYIRWLPCDDQYIYLQGQAYWIRANILLFQLTQDASYLDYVEKCANYIAYRQRKDGVWFHPPIWGRRGFISTVEGVWASLGLASAYKQLHDPIYLEAAERWYNFQIKGIGFQEVEKGLAANYYSHSHSKVPNVTTMLIWLSEELFQITKKEKYHHLINRMLDFIEYSQLKSGEIPYAIKTRPHFQCYQYNSFQFMDLANYYIISNNRKVHKIILKLCQFLSTGVTEKSSCRYDCFKENPETNYWTASLGSALLQASNLKMGQYHDLYCRLHSHLHSRQNSDGSFYFSEGNYYFFSDRRSYPRYQSMILYFLLIFIKNIPLQ